MEKLKGIIKNSLESSAMDREIGEIDAVHSQDLQRLFRQMGIADSFNKGELRCKFCHVQITEENIYSILPESGEFSLVCDKLECVIEMSEYLSEKNKKRPGV